MNSCPSRSLRMFPSERRARLTPSAFPGCGGQNTGRHATAREGREREGALFSFLWRERRVGAAPSLPPSRPPGGGAVDVGWASVTSPHNRLALFKERSLRDGGSAACSAKQTSARRRKRTGSPGKKCKQCENQS